MIIYSDSNLLVVNKSPGDYVQSGKSGEKSLIDKLEPEWGKLFPVHRIDVPVSGVVVFARTQKAAASLSAQFSATESAVIKRYICAVDNPPPAKTGRLENFILIPSGKKGNKVYIKDAAGKNIKSAILDYRQLFQTEKYHILEIILHTGRKHQIRAQLSNAGCHVKGDVKYGARRTNPGGGISLHALSLKIQNPETGKSIQFYAEPPEDAVWNAVKDGCSEYLHQLQTDSQKNNN